jgi:YNFM family putative membrane transporter
MPEVPLKMLNSRKKSHSGKCFKRLSFIQSDYYLGLQIVVFSLVSAAFTNIYITQPVLPVISSEFGVSETRASLTISMVVLGIAISNLPFGKISDRYPIKPIILCGGLIVTVCGFLCAFTHSMPLLISARFLQGLFIPSLTTCLAAYLAQSLPAERLNVVMGSYVSATVVGGLGGRLLGGWIHPPLHWRYAFLSASTILFVATLAAGLWLPRQTAGKASENKDPGFISLLRQKALLKIFFVAFASFFVFSSTFNYLPFYISAPPFNASTRLITQLYLSYIVGVIMGPLAGKAANRIGSGTTMTAGAVIFGLSLSITLIHSLVAIIISLAGICAGFFAVHASAVGALNQKLRVSRGRANSLYVLFYYLGGYSGITSSGLAYESGGWSSVILLGSLMLLIPLMTGLSEMRLHHRKRLHSNNK